jgi:hypothetical protein
MHLAMTPPPTALVDGDALEMHGTRLSGIDAPEISQLRRRAAAFNVVAARKQR